MPVDEGEEGCVVELASSRDDGRCWSCRRGRSRCPQNSILVFPECELRIWGEELASSGVCVFRGTGYGWAIGDRRL